MMEIQCPNCGKDVDCDLNDESSSTRMIRYDGLCYECGCEFSADAELDEPYITNVDGDPEKKLLKSTKEVKHD